MSQQIKQENKKSIEEQKLEILFIYKEIYK